MYYKINTYGCQMNVHESEKVAGLLEQLGYSETFEDSKADIIVFNTCCIRDNAERRAIGNIGVLKSLKKNNPNLIICVLGCMTQQLSQQTNLKNKFPYVDIVLGTRNLSILPNEIKKVIDNRLSRRKNDKKYRVFDTSFPENYLELDEITPQYRTSYPNAWINIIYGCNNFCTYCIVPYVRGRELSRKMEDVINEVKDCVKQGYKEITLLGQNVNSYGNDIDDVNISFANLLREIDKIDGKFRIRFMTSHPKDLNDDVIEVMSKSTKICNNIHLPIQSGSNKVLKEMNRKYTREHYFELIEKLRNKMPNIGITTDLMVGFPTETEKDFLDTMDLVKKVRYSNAFTFVYSPREGTPAAKMIQLSEEEKQKRIEDLIDLQNSITKELSLEYINNEYEVLCEDIQPKMDNKVCGRTESGRLVTFDGTKDDIGKFFIIKIDESRSASLFGHKVGEVK